MDTWKMEKHIIKDGADTYPWREVFAYWPVTTLSGKRVWWKKIWKRRVWIAYGSGFHMEPAIQYGTAFDMLNDPYEVRFEDDFSVTQGPEPKKVLPWEMLKRLIT